ncbi:MAG: single-stranded DNA-binding protein [Bifidobacteriaceae bacterium]|jgi:single-strand DNA-binding protein|nr:single-stranded DNA-binding protein [Bifidobacteriaceae bacterium]
MTSRTHITVRGNVVADPTIHCSNKDSSEFAAFRLASTTRLRDAQGNWSDGKTEWFDVAVFGDDFCRNVVKSLRRGNPVIVSGRLHTQEWESKEGKPGYSLKITAESIGHDLAWGRAEFVRVLRDESLSDLSASFETDSPFDPTTSTDPFTSADPKTPSATAPAEQTSSNNTAAERSANTTNGRNTAAKVTNQPSQSAKAA